MFADEKALSRVVEVGGIITEKGRWGWRGQDTPGQGTAYQGLGGRAQDCCTCELGNTLPK